MTALYNAKEQVLDTLINCSDTAALTDKILMRETLSDIIEIIGRNITDSSELFRFYLPIATRVMYTEKLEANDAGEFILDIIKFLSSNNRLSIKQKLENDGSGDEEVDPEAEYMGSLSTEFANQFFKK